MSHSLDSSIVRIRNSGGEVFGAGVLVGDGLVLTCAHVVSRSLELPDDLQEAPHALVSLDFPLVSPGHVVKARVVFWQSRSDIAGLKTEHELPLAASAARLVDADEMWNHPFRCMGFPSGHDDGVWATGLLRGLNAAGWVQIEGVSTTGYAVAPGFSGTPIWDEELDGITGIVVTAESKPEIKAAFVIPTRVLVSSWSILKNQLQTRNEVPAIKIFISFVHGGADDIYHVLLDQLREKHYAVVISTPHDTDAKASERLIDLTFSNIYVGIFALGGAPPANFDQGRSEYHKAAELGLERFVFLSDEIAPSPEATEIGHEGYEQLRAFSAELAANNPIRFFEIGDALTRQVVEAIDAWSQSRLRIRLEAVRVERQQADSERSIRQEERRVVNLRPLDLTHTFKNRIRQIQDLYKHLEDRSVRLVSVLGRGGMGKTALASRALEELEQGIVNVTSNKAPVRVDGILYLNSRSTGLELDRIYADVGRLLGEPSGSMLSARWADKNIPLAAKVEYLLEAMRNGVYLILLDNFEDYLDEEGFIINDGLRLFIERCLTQPAGVQLIITSREEVKITAPALYRLRTVYLHDGLPIMDSVALLRDLDPQGHLGLRNAPDTDLLRVSQLTRGIPRALEIVAGIIHSDPLTSLSALLDNADLWGERVVELLLAEGYSRLHENELRVLEALSVFDRPVSEVAVSYLLLPWYPGLAIHQCLRRLVRWYFVTYNRATSEYSLHPIDREYIYRHISTEDG